MMEMINALEGLVSFESVVSYEGENYPYGRETARAKDYVLRLAASLGFRTVDIPGKYAYVEIGSGEKLVGILSHIDVVGAGTGWTHEPFALTRDGGRLYGRGTLDDKGPTIAVIFAMKDILDSGKPDGRVRLILGQTEENGEWTDIEEYIANEELPMYGFTPDGDFPAIIYEKGAMVFKIEMPLDESGVNEMSGGAAANMVPSEARLVIEGRTYEGTGSAAHGCAPWLGRNAISDACRRAEAAGEKAAAVRMINELIADSIYGERLGIDSDNPLSGRLTINAGTVSTGDRMLCLMLDVRLSADSDPDEVEKTVKARFAEYGAEAACVYRTQPVSINPYGMVAEALIGAYRKVTGDFENEGISIGGGTYAKAMPNIVAYGPNFPGHENREHREDEYIEEADFSMLREIYKEAIERLLVI